MVCENCQKLANDVDLWKTKYKASISKPNETNLLFKDNHMLGCNLEGYADVLRYRGYEKEAEKLDEIASRLK